MHRYDNTRFRTKPLSRAAQKANATKPAVTVEVTIPPVVLGAGTVSEVPAVYCETMDDLYRATGRINVGGWFQ